jgi:hypothetical protein
VRRGRQQELGRYEAGTLALMLDNRDRRFDPTHAAGPYYPNVRPMKKVRVSASFGATSRVFTGFIEAWPQQWAIKNDAVAAVQAVDGFKVLALTEVTADYVAEKSGTRVGNVLDDVGWLAADRDIEDGTSTLLASSLENEAALTHLQQVELAENGRLFIAKDGALRFVDRISLYDATSGATLTEADYGQIVVDYDDATLYNDVRMAREGGTLQTAVDATSQTAYLKRTLTRSNLLISHDNEVDDAATFLLTNYKDPAIQVRGLTLVPKRTPGRLWPIVLSTIELGSKITVSRTPPGGGDPISQACWVEGIEHDVTGTPQVWTTRLRLSAVGVGYSVGTVWRLDSATLSKLGDTTRLVY